MTPNPAEVLRKLLVTAKLLQQNSVICAVRHHGADVAADMPSWLADCQKDIEAAEAALASPAPAGGELVATMTKALPGGQMDNATYEQIEGALDRLEAPCRSPDGRWLQLHERIAALSLTPPPSPDVAGVVERLPADVVELVIAARIVAYEDQSPEALRDLDKAAEAFSERVPWENDPEERAMHDATPEEGT